MDGYDAATYGDRFADVYDSWYPSDEASGDAVAMLAALAGDGEVLELGCGTGRLLLPLAAAGVRCVGIDSSAAMLDRLHANGDAAAHGVRTVVADMTDFSLDRTGFSLCFVAFNTLFNVPTADGLSRCFHAVAAHLRLGGGFVLECFVPPEAPASTDAASQDAVEVRDLAADRVVLRISRHDPAGQTITGQHVEFTDAGVRLRPWHLRYATPAELDAAAAKAGLVLDERFADWRSTPFTEDSATHVSVYRRGGAASS